MRSNIFSMLKQLLEAQNTYANTMADLIIQAGIDTGIIELKHVDGRPIEENSVRLTEKGALIGLASDLRILLQKTAEHKELTVKDKESVKIMLDAMQDVLSGKWTAERDQKEQERQGEEETHEQNNTSDGEPTAYTAFERA